MSEGAGGTGRRFPRWLNAQLRFGEKLEDFKIGSSSDRSGARQGDKGQTKALGSRLRFRHRGRAGCGAMLT
jgi:hypothetical protein